MLDFIIILYIFHLIMKEPYEKYELNIYVGKTGSGKSTIAGALAHEALRESGIITFCKDRDDRISKFIMSTKWFKRSRIVYSNMPIYGCRKIDPKVDLGVYLVENALILIDEAGIDYNSRNFKNFPDENRKFFKYHRHEKCSVAVFSQSPDDMDKVLRELAHNRYIVKSVPFCSYILAQKVGHVIKVNPKTDQLGSMDLNPVPFVDWTWYKGSKYWHMFDSYSRLDLEPKETGWEEYTRTKDPVSKYERLHYNLHDSLIILGIHPDSVLLKDVLLPWKKKEKLKKPVPDLDCEESEELQALISVEEKQNEKEE